LSEALSTAHEEAHTLALLLLAMAVSIERTLEGGCHGRRGHETENLSVEVVGATRRTVLTEVRWPLIGRRWCCIVNALHRGESLPGTLVGSNHPAVLRCRIRIRRFLLLGEGGVNIPGPHAALPGNERRLVLYTLHTPKKMQ
jgi:hypothetical protein